MELIVFDLDGTLLNRDSEISPYTRDTLTQLSEIGVAYTVATGRTLHASRDILEGHGFHLPQIFKNGVMIWDPQTENYSHQNFLSLSEIQHVLEAVLAQEITPFIFSLEPGNRHAIYHPPLQTEVEERLAKDFSARTGVEVLPASLMPADAEITNISALGIPQGIEAIESMVESEEHLVAYAGTALEGAKFKWIDIHHADASKGGAIEILRSQLGASKVICFGDSDNDLSMFALADECYAPDNAKESVKTAASAIIGHHDSDGIARFLRQRFKLEE
jgi:Cof subfamily protein (haloacid dehalogenase superfamily)